MMVNAKIKNEWADNELSKICELSEGPEDPELEPFRKAITAYKKCNEIFGDGDVFMEIHMLKMLLDENALTPIEDNDDEWVLVDSTTRYDKYYHERCPSLKKVIHTETNLAIFTDIERVKCVDVNKPFPHCCIELATKIVDAMYPIKFPYHSLIKYKMYFERFEDTLGFMKLREPGGKIVDIDKFFKLEEDGWIEIGRNEYLERRSKWKPGV